MTACNLATAQNKTLLHNLSVLVAKSEQKIKEF